MFKGEFLRASCALCGFFSQYLSSERITFKEYKQTIWNYLNLSNFSFETVLREKHMSNLPSRTHTHSSSLIYHSAATAYLIVLSWMIPYKSIDPPTLPRKYCDLSAKVNISGPEDADEVGHLCWKLREADGESADSRKCES